FLRRLRWRHHVSVELLPIGRPAMHGRLGQVCPGPGPGTRGGSMEAGDRQWEVEEQTLLQAVDAVRGALQPEPFPYLLMGGIASAILGRPRWTHDIDLFVRPEHARHVLETLERAGLSTEETDPYWLFKAF